MSSSIATTPTTPAVPTQPQPAEVLMQFACSFMASRALSIVAELRLADMLASGPKPVAELAKPPRPTKTRSIACCVLSPAWESSAKLARANLL